MSQTLFFLLPLTLIPTTAIAQITPDSSLGNENSVVETNGNRDTIKGGAIRDANLFHSFTEFNVEALREAYFNNPDGIANIFSRVTGNNISDIQGVLGVLGNANLYLINPNGILFGENARLDVNGSFFATTADSVVFGNGLEFSAANPNQAPLLTINIPIGLRFRDNPGTINNRANSVGLEVQPGENITLVGGEINFEAGEATAPGGSVNLGGLSAAGTVTINDFGSLSFPEGIARANVTLTNAAAVDVRAGGGGSININARNLELSGGDLGRSRLRAGIASGSGSLSAQAGDITLNATDTINVSQGSAIFNQVSSTGVGNSGGINITTTDLSLTEGGFVSASIFGVGNGEAITINAEGNVSAEGGGIFSRVDDTGEGTSGGIEIKTTDLTLTEGAVVNASTSGVGNAGAIIIEAEGNISAAGESPGGTNSSIFSQVTSTGEGDSGGIEIKTNNLSLTEGGFVSASTFGLGNAGAIIINAEGNISAAGEDRDGFNSGIYSRVDDTGEGTSGGIEIKTTDLTLTEGGRVNASTLGVGDAGAVTIEASGNISAAGEDSDGFNSGIFSTVTSTGEGISGGIEITTTDLTLTEGGILSASTFGLGNAGAVTIFAEGSVSAEGGGIFSRVDDTGEGTSGGIEITTTDLSLTEGAVVNASTSGVGNAGAIIIEAEGNISAAGESPGGTNSSIFSQVTSTGEGDSGGIEIKTNNLTLTEGGFVSASTFGLGNAGAIIINAEGNISAAGEDRDGFNSGIYSRVDDTGEGTSGGIEIKTTDLTLTEGGRVNASTLGVGDAGAVTIEASGNISAAGEDSDGFNSGIFSTVTSTGEGDSGGIEITTTDLSLTEGAVVNASTSGLGNAGAVTIEANGNISAAGEDSDGFNSGIFSTVTSTGEGDSGGIEITTTDLTLTEGGILSASTFGLGNAGAVTIFAEGSVSAEGGGIFSRVDDTGEGTSGGIEITTTDLSLTEGAVVNASTSGVGDAGAVTIEANGNISAEGGGIFSTVEDTGVGDSGGIEITTTDLFLTEGGRVNASTFGLGNAGAITINANGNISAAGESADGTNSGIFSTVTSTGVGTSGGIEITTNNLTLTEGAVVNASTSGVGDAGAVTIKASGNISAAGENTSGTNSGIRSRITSTGVGTSGGIEIKTNNLSLTEGAVVSASTSGVGNGGDITINAEGHISAAGEDRDGFNSGIFSTVNDTENRGKGNSGGINITTTDLSLTEGGVVNASTFGLGNAGAITINANGNISAAGESADGTNSGIFSTVTSTGVGTSGRIEITTNNLTLTEGAVVNASTSGVGDAGAVTIKASGNISAAGEDRDGFNSGIRSRITSTGVGTSGGIEIKTNNLSLTEGAVVSASTSGVGNGGDITINAEGSVSAAGSDRDGFNSGIFSTVNDTENRGKGNSGRINITTTDLSLTEGGVVNASTFGLGNAGAITINAKGHISAAGENSDGFNSGIFSTVTSTGVGTSDGINITTNNLTLTEGAVVNASTSGVGDAGAVTIEANGNISAAGSDRDGFNSGIFSTVTSTAEGTSGKIEIKTTDLFLTEGGQVNANTSGVGDAGAVTIEANGNISAAGESADGTNSGIRSQVTSTGVGNSGGIEITTNNLSLTEGSFVSASTFGLGNAGAIIINAEGNISAAGKDRNGINSGIYSRVEDTGKGTSGKIKITATDLFLTEGGLVNASTLGVGNAGAITIETSGNISVEGEDSEGDSSGIYSRVASTGVGDSGGIEITTNDLSLTNNAEISVSSSGQGNAKNLLIQANSIALSNGSSLSASTPVETGGSITLQIADNLILRESSTISARATRDANGGNVTIDSQFIIAVPNQNNDIIASANQGQGGEINITTEGIFGIEERPLDPRTNDINASSDFGLNGNISLNTPIVDPTTGLLELTEEVVDAAELIAQNVCTQTADSEFADIGKGGLPKNPEYVLTEDTIEVGLVAPVQVSSTTNGYTEIKLVQPKPTRQPPAQGWIFLKNGTVELVAHNPNQLGEQRSWDNHKGCQ